MLCGLTSCGVQKIAASQEVQANSKVQAYDSTELSALVKKLAQEMLTENIKSMTSQEVEIKTTVYSPPDSTGEQYVIETQVTTIKAHSEEVKQRIIESSEEVTEIIDSTTISASIEDLEMESSTDIQEKKGLPWWQMTLMLIGSAVLIMIILRIVLKFI